MSNQDKLNLYIRQLHQRLRLGVSLRGVALLMATALITTIFLVLILNAFAFPVRGLTGARSLLLLVLGRSGRMQDGRVHDRAGRDSHPLGLQVQVHPPQNLFAQNLLHLLQEVCTNVLILKRGDKVADGTIADVAAQFSNGEANVSLEEVFITLTGRALRDDPAVEAAS